MWPWQAGGQIRPIRFRAPLVHCDRMEARMYREALQWTAAMLCASVLVGCTAHGGPAMTESHMASTAPFAPNVNAAVVRYQVQDVDRALAFYAQHLGFQLTQRSGPVAIVSRGELHLLL